LIAQESVRKFRLERLKPRAARLARAARYQKIMGRQKQRLFHDNSLPEAQRMAKAVQQALLEAGMFDECLASLKKASKGNVWRSLLAFAKLFMDRKVFFVDIEGVSEGKRRRGPTP